MDSYTERLELPDDQWAVLLTRLPYDRAHRIELASATGKSVDESYVRLLDAAMRAHLWQASLRHALTGETIDADQVDDAEPPVIEAIRARALQLNIAWRRAAYPKGKAAKSTRRAAGPQTEAEADASE